jgi:hypothetical protein
LLNERTLLHYKLNLLTTNTKYYLIETFSRDHINNIMILTIFSVLGAYLDCCYKISTCSRGCSNMRKTLQQQQVSTAGAGVNNCFLCSASLVIVGNHDRIMAGPELAVRGAHGSAMGPLTAETAPLVRPEASQVTLVVAIRECGVVKWLV